MNLPKAFTGKKNEITAVIETPRNSNYKYKYVSKYRMYKLNKMLPAGTVFPLDMGFIPNTKGDDGDPLDVLVLMENPSFQGCFIECRLLGVIEAFQKEKKKKEKRNDRIIAVPSDSVEYSHIKNLQDLEKRKLEDLISFFEFYNKIEKKTFRVIDISGAKKAKSLIKKALL